MTEDDARALAADLRTRRGILAIATTARTYGVEPGPGTRQLHPWIVVANGTIIRDRKELQ